MNQETLKIYGRPKGEGLFIQEFYCAICNKIPTIETIDHSVGTVLEVTILDLNSIPTFQVSKGQPDRVYMMLCTGCTNKVKEGVKKQLSELGFIKRKPPDEGGVPSKK